MLELVVLAQFQHTAARRRLKLQDKFVLAARVKFEAEVRAKPAVTYVADFTYFDDDNNFIVEDVKGMITPVYRLKKHLMMDKYGIEIREIK